MGAIDFGVFGRGKSLIDQQQLQQAFEYQKQQQALQAVVLARQAAGIPDPKDLLAAEDRKATLAERTQNHQDSLTQRADLAQQSSADRMALAQLAIGGRQDARQDKAEQVQTDKMNKAQTALDSLNAGYDQQLANVDKLVSAPGFGSIVGAVDSRTPTFLPEATDALNQYNTTISNSMVQGLAGLKAASPTGASGFGSLTEKEGQIIREAQGKLQRTGDEKAVKAGFEDYKAQLLASKQRVNDAFNRQFGNLVQPIDINDNAGTMGNVPIPAAPASPAILRYDATGKRIQ